MGDQRRRESCNESAYVILVRMLADAERLCAMQDPLLTGQAAQLRGRIGALVTVATPPSLLLAEARP